MSKQQDIPNLKVEGIVSKNTCEVVTHYVFTFCLGKNFKVNEKFWLKKSQRNCKKIAEETRTEVEMCSLNKMNLIFLVKGQNADVVKAKRKIIETFQTQDTNANSIPIEFRCEGMKKQSTEIVIALNDRCLRLEGAHSNTTQNVNCEETKLYSEIFTTDIFNITMLIPKAIFPHILGPYRRKIKTLIKITGVHFKYIYTPANDMNHIVISGDLDSIQWVSKRLESDFKIIEKEFIEIFVEMPKEKYKYFSHAPGLFGDDIMNETNVYVKLPEKDSNNQTIILRGPYHAISLGLNAFYTKINNILYETIECSTFIYTFLMGKNASNLRKLLTDEQIHVEYIAGIITIEGPFSILQKMTDALKKEINNFVSQNYIIGKKYFLHLASGDQYYIKYIERKCDILIKIDFMKSTFSIHGLESDVKMAIEKFDQTVKKIKKICTQEIFIRQKPLEELGLEIISDIQKSFDVVIKLSDSPGILAKICGFQGDVNKAFDVLSKLSFMGSVGTFTINTEVQGEHTDPLTAMKYCYTINNRREKVYINNLKNDGVNVIQALLNALEKEENNNFERNVEEENINIEKVEVTEAEVAQAMPATLKRNENNNCDKNVEKEENINIEKLEVTEAEVAQALPATLERNENNNCDKNVEEENINIEKVEDTEAEVTQVLASVLRMDDNCEKNVESTEEIKVFYGPRRHNKLLTIRRGCWKCRGYNHRRLDCPVYHRTTSNKPIGFPVK